MMRHGRLLIALFLYAVIAALFVGKALLPDWTLVPTRIIQDSHPWWPLDLGARGNDLVIDPLYIFYPNRHFFREAILSGQWPFWNPHLFTGTPTIADPNFQTFYPLNWLTVWLPVHHALDWLAWAHLTIAGTAMYLFLRPRVRQWAAFGGGGLWMLNGYIIVWLENPHRLSTLAWLPAVFWALDRGRQSKNLAWIGVGGLLLGLAMLGGQVQFIWCFGLLLAGYALCLRSWWALVATAAIGAMGLAIGSLVWLPALEFAGLTARGAGTADMLQTALPLRHLATLILPDLFGSPIGETAYTGHLNYAETCFYFGAIGAVLAVVGGIAKPKCAAVPLLIIALLLIFGSPLVRVAAVLPGFDFIALNRLIVVVPFLGAWLAAVGIDALCGRWRWLGRGLMMAAVLQLFVWGQPFNPIHETAALFPERAVTAVLQAEAAVSPPFRVLPLQQARPLYGPNILSVYGLSDITGYASLIHNDYAQLIAVMGGESGMGWMNDNPNIVVMSHFHPLISLLNVRYVVAADTLFYNPELTPIAQSDGVVLHENGQAAPRAFVVHHGETADHAATFAQLPGLDWRQTVLLPTDVPARQMATLTDTPQASTSTAVINEYAHNRIVITVDGARPGVLIVGDAAYPGWKATVDGVAAEIYRVNGMQRGVFVDGGSSVVEMVFRPTYLRYAAAGATAGMVVALGLIGWAFLDRRRGTSDV